MFQKDIIIHLIKFSVSFLKSCFFANFSNLCLHAVGISVDIFPWGSPPTRLCCKGKGAGTGTAAYNSPEEVAQAIATLNGWGEPSNRNMVTWIIWGGDIFWRGFNRGVEERDLPDFLVGCFLVVVVVVGSLQNPSDWGSPVSNQHWNDFAGLPWVVLPSRWMLGSKLQRWVNRVLGWLGVLGNECPNNTGSYKK